MTSKRLTQLNSFLEESPDDSFLLFAVAKEYEKLGDLGTALTFYLKLQKVDADYVGLYYHLGKLYEELEEEDKALNTYTQGILIAQKNKDQHALSELKGAKINLELGL